MMAPKNQGIRGLSSIATASMDPQRSWHARCNRQLIHSNEWSSHLNHTSTAMFTTTIQYQNVQRAICLFFSALIVSSAPTLGYVGAEVAEQNVIAALSEARA